MFIAALARPRFDYSRNQMFDGKIGIWPFSEIVNAKRASKNRPKGTPEVKPITSVTKVHNRNMIIEKIIPAIVDKWPRSVRNDTPKVFIQQDNAGPHIAVDDPEFLQAVSSVDSMQIRIISQPAMSPDLNILDLGFFNSIQSLHYRKLCRTYEELQKNVCDAFANYKVSTLSDLWLTLQAIYNEVIKAKGNNNYKLPHLKEEALRKQGRLQENVSVCSGALKSMRSHQEFLNNQDKKKEEVDTILKMTKKLTEV